MEKLRIGWAEVDITPPKGTKIGLDGQFFERITDTVESPISVTALAIDNGSDCVIMCSCDLVGIGDNLNQLVKERLLKDGTVDPNKVIISATHPHTSYTYTRTASVDTYLPVPARI